MITDQVVQNPLSQVQLEEWNGNVVDVLLKISFQIDCCGFNIYSVVQVWIWEEENGFWLSLQNNFIFVFVIVFGLGQTYLVYTETQMLQFRSVIKTHFFP